MVNDLKQKGDNTYKKNIFLISHTSFSSGGFVIRLRSFIVLRILGFMKASPPALSLEREHSLLQKFPSLREGIGVGSSSAPLRGG